MAGRLGPPWWHAQEINQFRALESVTTCLGFGGRASNTAAITNLATTAVDVTEADLRK